MSDGLLTCLQVARILGLRPATIRAWTSRRKIPSIRVGSRSVRYRVADIQKVITAGLRPALRPLHAPEDPTGENGGGA
jgi:excisionase family DNA binding protein